MWEVILKLLTALSPLAAAGIPLALNYRQNGGRNTTALMDTLARVQEKDTYSGYLVEFCIARLHNIRPLPWSFLKEILPCSHAQAIIQQVSFGRRFLDLYDVSVHDGRPVVRYADTLGTPGKRLAAMIFYGFFIAVFMASMLWNETQLLDLFLNNRWRETISSEVKAMMMLYSVLMMICGGIVCMLFIQFMALALAAKRLKRIDKLISVNFPDPTSGCRQEPDKDVSD